MSPTGWREIAVGDLLVFASPVVLTPAQAQGIDTAASEWCGNDLLVRIDHGLFVDPLTRYARQAGCRVFDLSIDGQPAKGVAFDQADGSRFTAVHFPRLSLPRAGSNKLTFVVISRGDRTAEDAMRIARSIRFCR
ncbi:MAG: hypothetical protein ACRD2X_02070 [Vicinamibacteraceae bacterium]